MDYGNNNKKKRKGVPATISVNESDAIARGSVERSNIQMTHRYGAAALPAAKTQSNSSDRIRAAYACYDAKLGNRTSNQKHVLKNRATKKREKQDQNMFNVPPRLQVHGASSIHDNSIVFVNGNKDNSPLAPNIDNPKKKSIVILSVSQGDLRATQRHLSDPSKGLVCRPSKSSDLDEALSFMLVPRMSALTRTHCFKHRSETKLICEALDAMELKCKASTVRGSKIVLEEDQDKYVCTGTQPRRAAPGVEPIHYILNKVEHHHALTILKLFKRIEHLFEEWSDTRQIGIVHAAMNLIDAPTFTIPGTASPARIFGGIAWGRNVYLSSHKDKDFTYSAITIHIKDCEYDLDNRVVAYFCFRKLGIAVPLRPGDVLFFNPQDEHCISSRCHPEDNIYCISFYLKSANIGLNDNSIELMPKERFCLNHFNDKMI